MSSSSTTTLTSEQTVAPTFGPFRSLRFRDYRFLWVGILFSSSGQWMEQVAMGWLILQLTNSPFYLGLASGLRAIPFLLLGPWGGVVADRVDRRKLLMVTQVGIVALTLVLATLVVTRTIQTWQVLVITTLLGTVWSINQPVRQAIVPNLVERHYLTNAIALQSSGFNITRIVGPSLAGLIISLVDVGGVFLVNAITCTIVIWLTYLMRVPATDKNSAYAGFLENMGEGIQYLRSHKVVLGLIGLDLIPMVLVMPYSLLMPVFARDVFGIGASGLGLLTTTPGLGALTGTLALAFMVNLRHRGRWLVGCGLAMGTALVLFAAAPWLPLSLVFLVVFGAASMSYRALNNTLIATLVPDNLRGRVMSLYFLDQGLMPLGSLLAGILASLLGAPWTVILMSSTSTFVALIAVMRMPYIRKLQ